ncbi:hypothetical protein CTI12_AA447330 [Artemisia annua]|uniref:Helitron helicase-like domain-containing protein n=1 Tax=Artemisia annua TaxID=35608 RepID=A0A2U1LVX9_ARTAN|nr:hypothetical protein CTI12_AA447330 [Artemisia annua]
MNPFTHDGHTTLNPEIVEQLMHILDEHNELVQVLRTARDKCNERNIPELKIQLYNVVGARQYNLPTSGTLGAIVFEEGSNTRTDYDIIIEYKNRNPKRVNKLHSSYMSLQFPLLFVYGQPGYNIEMELNGVNAHRKRKKISMKEYYTYQLHERKTNLSICEIRAYAQPGCGFAYYRTLDLLALDSAAKASAAPDYNGVSDNKVAMASATSRLQSSSNSTNFSGCFIMTYGGNQDLQLSNGSLLRIHVEEDFSTIHCFSVQIFVFMNFMVV